MPSFLEAERVDIETSRAIHVGNEKDRACVPPVNSLASRGVVRHTHSVVRLTDLPLTGAAPPRERYLTLQAPKQQAASAPGPPNGAASGAAASWAALLPDGSCLVDVQILAYHEVPSIMSSHSVE